MIVLLITPLLVFSTVIASTDVCKEFSISDGVTLNDLINAECFQTLIRERRAEETYHSNDDGHDHHEDEDHEDEDHEDEDHLGHGEEKESAMEECEENGRKWCPSNTDMKACFDTTNTTQRDSFCQCTDAGGTNITWDGATCTSDERSTCNARNSTYNAFYKGICYNSTLCLDDGYTWKNGTTGSTPTKAGCGSLIWWCGQAKGTHYTVGNGTVKKSCGCPDKGATWHETHCDGATKPPSKSAAWGYGIIATAIISAFAVFGVVIVLFRDQWWYDIVLSTMVALAAGCLLADALLHLIPLALGLHDHDHGGEDDHLHAEEKEEENPNNTLHKTLGVLGGVYLFLLFEKAIHSAIPHEHEHKSKVMVNPAAVGNELKDLSPRRESMKSIAKEGLCSVNSVAWMIIFGDALHNFADGLVLGASFIASISLGLGTSVAVLCHEVPHELGDFAVLLNAGMKVKWAILFNFASACACFLGLFLGLVIGEEENTQNWIFAFTAGMFIYISCADLIPEMNRMCENSNYPKLCFALQQVGFFIGVLIMLIIALYEEELEAIGGGEGH